MSYADQIPQTIEEDHQYGLHEPGTWNHCSLCAQVRIAAERDTLRARVKSLEAELGQRMAEVAVLVYALERIAGAFAAHRDAWEHDCGGDEEVDDCRACQYGELHDAAREALARVRR